MVRGVGEIGSHDAISHSLVAIALGSVLSVACGDSGETTNGGSSGAGAAGGSSTGGASGSSGSPTGGAGGDATSGTSGGGTSGGGTGGGTTRLACPGFAPAMDGVITSAVADTSGPSTVEDVDVLCDGSFVMSGHGPGSPYTVSFPRSDGTPLEATTEDWVAAFDPAGHALWVQAPDLGASDGRGGSFLSMFGDGSVLVGGVFGTSVTFGIGEPNETTFTATDITVEGYLVRYTSNGALAWARHFGPPSNSLVLDVAAGVDGTAYAIVYANLPGLVIGPGELDLTLGAEEGAVVALSPEGRFVNAFRFAQSTIDSPKLTTLANGALLFATESGSGVTLAIGAPDQVELPPGGVLYVQLGTSLELISYHDVALEAASLTSSAMPDGSIAFAHTFYDMVTLGPGEPSETTFTNNDMQLDVFVAKIDPAGRLAWAQHIQGPDLLTVRAASGAADGAVWVAGRALTTGSSELVAGVGSPDEIRLAISQSTSFVVRFSPAGTPEWINAVPFAPASMAAWPLGAILAGEYSGTVMLGPPSGLTFGPANGETAFAAILGP